MAKEVKEWGKEKRGLMPWRPFTEMTRWEREMEHIFEDFFGGSLRPLKMDLEVLLMRAYAIPVMGFTGEDYYTPNLDRLLEEAKDEAKRYLEQKVTQLKGEGLKRVSSRFLEGESANQIIDFARKIPDNLIAMCTHGRSGIGRLVLGSVTSRVVRHSGDPVLVVRASAGT